MTTPISLSNSKLQKIDLIWNMTRICPWDCKECCVDAIQVARRGNEILLRSDGLSKSERIPLLHEANNTIFDQALHYRQSIGLELDLAGKRKVLDHLEGYKVKLDISGGDGLIVSENYQLLKEASARFGKEQITLTATGAALARYNAQDIAPYISEFNFTYDNFSPKGNETRPAGYATGNIKSATLFADLGVSTRAECPLSRQNAEESILHHIYLDLHKAGIQKLLLMRLFPVGRGTLRKADIPTPNDYRRAIEVLRDLEEKYKYPVLRLQCALKLFDDREIASNPCDMVSESFGLMPDGTLLCSPWAFNGTGQPLNDAWVLGNLAESSLREILSTKKVQAYQNRLDENLGHCKIFSFLHSKRSSQEDRIFDKSDPLYLAT